jgi:nitric oxide reductase subunit B
MALCTLLPMGIPQLSATLEHGYWYARSAEFMQKPIIQLLVRSRVPADSIFSIGALSLAWFVFRPWVKPCEKQPAVAAEAVARQTAR